MLQTKKRIDSQNGRRYRCYATKAEVLYPAVYALRKRNFKLTQLDNFVEIVTRALVWYKIELCRIRSSGDFYNFGYFMKWYEIAKINPDVIFFGYSKQATFVKYLLNNPLPNMKLNYSMGGLMDVFALEFELPLTYVETPENTKELKHIKRACTPENYTNDFAMIMKGETFKIKLH